MKLKITPEMRAKWKRINAKRKAANSPALNFPLLVKTRNRIDAIPESYYQGRWIDRQPGAPCGTVACLRGEAEIANAPSVQEGIKRMFRLARNPFHATTSGAKLLGLAPREAEVMFSGSADRWPDKYRFAHGDANNQRGRARAAVAYLTHVIRTGKVTE